MQNLEIDQINETLVVTVTSTGRSEIIRVGNDQLKTHRNLVEPVY